MSFSLFKVVIEDNKEKREYYEYGKYDFDAIEHALERHGYLPDSKVYAKKIGNALDLLDSAGHYNEI